MTDKKKELLRSIKFTLFSISAGVIQFGSYTVFYSLLGWSPELSHLLSLILSVLWNFTLNRKYTFCSASNVPVAMAKVAAFYLVFTPLSTWWTKALTAESVGWDPFLVEILTMLVNFVTEFLYDRFFVFGNSLDTAKKE